MNIALPPLVLILLVIPGIVFLRVYQRGLEGLPVIPRPFIEYLPIAIVCASFIHFSWLLLLSSLRHWLSVEPDVRALTMYLVGRFGPDDKDLPQALAAVSNHGAALGVYYFGSILLAFVAGLGLHAIVGNFMRLRRSWLLGFRDQWHRILIEKHFFKGSETSDVDPSSLVACVTAIIELGGVAYLYDGAVEDIVYDENSGQLDRLLLREVSRRPLLCPTAPQHSDPRIMDAQGNQLNQEPSDPTSESERVPFYPILGDLFILRYAETKTLNIRYWSVEPDEESQGPTDLAD